MDRFRIPATRVIAMLALVGILSCGKRSDSQQEEELQPGEPEQYRATVVRIIDDGSLRDAAVTREARAGDKRRQEWTEEGRSLAMIWRPDLGKYFLLDLDARSYLEYSIIDPPPGATTAGRQAPRSGALELDDANAGLLQGIDRAIDEPLSPLSVEARRLPDEVIQGYVCKVTERRASFADGHSEMTRSFRAGDLAGLALRVESSGAGNQRIITERRDVVTDVPADEFEVPAGFKKVDNIERR